MNSPPAPGTVGLSASRGGQAAPRPSSDQPEKSNPTRSSPPTLPAGNTPNSAPAERPATQRALSVPGDGRGVGACSGAAVGAFVAAGGLLALGERDGSRAPGSMSSASKNATRSRASSHVSVRSARSRFSPPLVVRMRSKLSACYFRTETRAAIGGRLSGRVASPRNRRTSRSMSSLGGQLASPSHPRNRWAASPRRCRSGDDGKG